MKEKGRIIEGFYFTDEKIAEQAKRESDGVQYIKENTDMENPEKVLQLYHKLIVEQLFETPIGISFLKELRDYLAAAPGINEKEIEAIPTEILLKEAEVRKVKREKTADRARMEKRLAQTKKNLRTSLLVNLFLVIVVIGILIITMTSDQPNIINYENKLIDKYAQWQQELEAREQTVKEKERELEITP